MYKREFNFITENKVVSHFFTSTVTTLQKELVHVSSYTCVSLALWTRLGVWRPLAKATCTTTFSKTSNNSWPPLHLCSPNCLYKQHPKHEPIPQLILYSTCILVIGTQTNLTGSLKGIPSWHTIVTLYTYMPTAILWIKPSPMFISSLALRIMHLLYSCILFQLIVTLLNFYKCIFTKKYSTSETQHFDWGIQLQLNT